MNYRDTLEYHEYCFSYCRDSEKALSLSPSRAPLAASQCRGLYPGVKLCVRAEGVCVRAEGVCVRAEGV